MIASAFTCTGPYAILILLGIKRVENRSAMPAPARGRCAVSCSKSFCPAEFGAFVHWASRALPPAAFARIPSWGEVKDWPGRIVGACDYAAHGRNDLVLEPDAANEADGGRTRQVSPSRRLSAKRMPQQGCASLPWDEGYAYWWDLSEAVRFGRPIPCRGNVGMWPLPPDLAALVNAADAQARKGGD